MQRGSVALFFCSLAFARAASAVDVPPARLVYLPGAFAAACPSADDVKRGIAARLALDPFAEPAERVLLIAVEGRTDAGVPVAVRRARIELFDAAMEPLGERVIDSDEGCHELMEAAALAASIALAPERALAPPPVTVLPVAVPPPVAAPPAVEEPPVEEPTEIVADARATWPFLPEGAVLLGGLGSSWSLFLGPGIELGPGVSAALRLGDLELRGEIKSRAGWSSNIASVHGAVTATALPCLHLPLIEVRGGDPVGLHACGSGTIAMVWAAGGYLGMSPYAGVGGQLGLEWVQPDRSALRLWGQMEAALFRPIYIDLTDGQLLDQAAPANAAIGVTFEIPLSP